MSGPSVRHGKLAKPREIDVIAVRGLAIDVDNVTDWIAARAAVVDYLPPTLGWITGGGMQFVWLYPEPMTDVPRAKGQSEACTEEMREVVGELGVVDSTQSVDHVFRLPGFVNRKPERKGRRARVFLEDWDQRIDPEASASVGLKGIVPVILSIDHDVWDEEAVRTVLDGQGLPLKLLTDCSGYGSRSEWMFAFIGGVLGGMDTIPDEMEDMVASCLLNPRWPISDYAYVDSAGKPRRDPEGEIERQIGKWLAKNGFKAVEG